jgi:hypothetical protein
MVIQITADGSSPSPTIRMSQKVSKYHWTCSSTESCSLRCLPMINHLLITSATLQGLDNSPGTIAILLSLHYFISAKCPSVLID